MNIFRQARQKEIDYHEKFYAETELFQAGSWLSRPVKIVIDSLQKLKLDNIRVLDLGCGVGRNSIPIAQQVKAYYGEVTCIDLLPSAIELLQQYARKHDVEDVLISQVADIEDYHILKDHYDYIVACSCLEHVSSEEVFIQKIKQMQEGTKQEGINCILMSTEVKECEIISGIEHEGLIELNLSTDRAFSLLSELYTEWEITNKQYVNQEIKEEKAGNEILFKSNWITWVARRRGGFR